MIPEKEVKEPEPKSEVLEYYSTSGRHLEPGEESDNPLATYCMLERVPPPNKMAKTGTTSEIYVPDVTIFGLTTDSFAVIVEK